MQYPKHDDSPPLRNLFTLKTLERPTNNRYTCRYPPSASHALMENEQVSALPDDLTFEQAMKRLEVIVKNLEGDSCDLEDALSQHAEGVALARFCMDRLNAAELKIQNLTLE